MSPLTPRPPSPPRAAYIEDAYDGMRRLQRAERKRIEEAHRATGR